MRFNFFYITGFTKSNFRGHHFSIKLVNCKPRIIYHQKSENANYALILEIAT